MRTFLFCCALAFSCILTAQTNGTFYSEHDLPLEATNALQYTDQLHTVELLTFTAPDRGQRQVTQPFIASVLDAVSAGNLQLQNRSGESVAVNTYLRSITNIDTVITINPDTSEEEIKIVHNPFLIGEDVKIRVKLSWQYDTRQGKLMPSVEAFALLINPEMSNIWIINPKRTDRSAYTKRGSHRVNLTDFDSENVKPILQLLLPKAKIAYRTTASIFPTQLTGADISITDPTTSTRESVDTVITFHPVTYTEKVEIVRTAGVAADYIDDKIQLNLDWAFFTSGNQPGIRVELRSLVTLRSMRGRTGDFVYYRPLRAYVFE